MDLRTQTEYKKGGLKATLTFYPEQEKPFNALTPTQTKWYKTRKCAENFLKRIGYTKV